MVKPRKSNATHVGVRVKKDRWLTVFERPRKKKKTPVRPPGLWPGPFAQA
jgi:hypothetical protein